MKRAWLAAILLLGACGKTPTIEQTSHSLATFDVAAPGEESAPAAAGPQVAYSYQLSYLLDGRAIAGAQAKAQAECRRLGPNRCLVTRSDLNRSTDGDDAASLHLLIDARLANGFEQRLGTIATDAGGAWSGRQVVAEDVTKQIVDTGARVRAKQALAERLLGIIRSANGKVGELIEAEKAYAQVQEELDAARTLDAELRRRVAMSAVDITYNSRGSVGTWSPVTRAVGDVAGSFATSIAALLTFVVVAIPWVLLLAGAIWLLRRIGWRPRWPWRRANARETPPTA